MTMEEKKAWLGKATNEELIHQLKNLVSREARECSFGKGLEDIELTEAEIIKRMNK